MRLKRKAAYGMTGLLISIDGMQDNFKINAEICDSNRAGSAVRDGGIEPKIVAGCGIEKTFVGPSYR